MSVVDELKRLELLKGRGKQTDLRKLCHAGRLVGGLSISLRATADEVIGPLTFALGGAAKALRVIDVRIGAPIVLEIEAGELHEKWELVDLQALTHNLNDLYRSVTDVKAAVALGEWEDMLQVWCVEKAVLPALLERRLLEGALNVQTLRRIAEEPSRDGSSTEFDR